MKNKKETPFKQISGHSRKKAFKVKEPFQRARRGSRRRGTVGGQVFLDRDYSSGFKKESTKYVFISLCMLPSLIAAVTLWIVGLKIFSIAILVLFLVLFLAWWILSKQL